MNRNLVIALGVVLFHVAALWALQTGLVRRAVEIIVPAEMLSEFITPPAPKADTTKPPTPPTPPIPPRQSVVKARQPVAPPAPQPLAIADASPAPNAPTGVTSPQPPAPPIAAPVAAAPAAPAGPPKVELPSSDADYLQNPRPAYPPISKRLGEQGKVVVRVLIGADGMPQKAELKKSSGFERLDRSAMDYVMKCRYVAGKVGGVAQAMWYDAPVNFVLE